PPPPAAPRVAVWMVAQPQKRAGTRGPGGTASRRRCVVGCDTSLFSPLLMGTAALVVSACPASTLPATRRHRLQISSLIWAANLMPPVPGLSGRLWRRYRALASLMASSSQGCSLTYWPSVRGSRSYPPRVPTPAMALGLGDDAK